MRPGQLACALHILETDPPSAPRVVASQSREGGASKRRLAGTAEAHHRQHAHAVDNEAALDHLELQHATDQGRTRSCSTFAIDGRERGQRHRIVIDPCEDLSGGQLRGE
jgi:hypothetical protein